MRLLGKMSTNLLRAVHAVLAAALGALIPSAVAAHPHVWVTFEMEVLFDKNQAINGFQYKWTFDELYTAFAIQGLDKNNDGKYDREELKELAAVNVTSLKEFEYFTFAKAGDSRIARQEPRDYWLEYANGVLSLSFTLPLAQPVPKESVKDFSVALYDPSFYVDFAPAQQHPVRLTGSPEGCVPIINNPKPEITAVQQLGEAFFTNADAASSLAAQYAKTITIACPAN